jgi:methyltransferase (TIGR00027 family)
MRPAVRVAAAVILLALARTAQPVSPGAVSKTAEATCEFRAIAAQHPDPRLRNADRYAARLCGATLLPRDYEAARGVIDDNPEAFAAYFYVNARTRYIDHQLRRAARRGVEQVVILGAGFDSRAYRFHGPHPRITFFEVDLPATIRAKEQAVSKMLGAAPGYVRYVPVDFDRQALESELPRAGYDAKRRTLFVLEGVTMYVGKAGIGATFDFMARRAPRGSLVVFDYILRRVAEGDYAGLYAASGAAKGVARLGEPFVTGWTPAEAAAFAGRHGLAVREDLDAAALERGYLTGSDGKSDGRIPEWYRVVRAEVR